MIVSAGPRVFLSYARSDLDAALDLRGKIESELGEGSVWHDVRNLAGDHWWTEIEDAIRGRAAVEHVVLLASARALTRDVIRREWRLAWREGKAVTNVLWTARDGFSPPDFAALPDWVGAKSMLDLSLPDRWQALITRLKEPGQGPRRPFMAPAMPEGFVGRPEEFAKLKTALLDGQGNAVAITAALRGAGGFGKTVLAQALAHDDDIQDAFHDGVLWVTLGERPSLIEKLADLLKTLTGEPQGFTEVSAAANKLREVLAERKCLLVIDDVWSESHLRPFTDGGPLTARLVTTRRDDILPKDALRVPVDAMKEAEAIELLSQGLGEIGMTEQAALRALATERLGEWPVIIRLVNGFLRKEVERGAPPADAIQQANDRLDRKKLTVFDRNDETAREAAVESTIRASIDYLVEEIGKGQDANVYNSQRYDELAVFPEDVEVPIATIARLWRRVAEVGNIDARDLLKHLYSLALLQALDLKRGTVRLHDVMRKYLTQKQAGAALNELHHQFVEAYDAASGPDIEDVEERRYFYTWFPTHLHEAGEREVLDELLLDPQWMKRKLDALEGPLPLIDDFEKLVADRRSLHGLIGRTLRLTSGILTRDRRQLMPQLHGRLLGITSTAASRFLPNVRRLITGPAILTQRASLTQPGAEIARLELTEWIDSLVLLPDGRLASGGTGNTIRLWDSKRGTETARLEGHSGPVNALAVLPDGRLASGSNDNTIRVWDVTSGTEVARFEGHTGWVNALAVLPDDRLASGSNDKTIRLWDLKSGTETALIQGHDHEVTALTALPNGRLVSGAGGGDGTIRLWDLRSCVEISRIGDGSIRAMALMPDGRLASNGSYNTIRLWDLENWTEVARFEGHRGWVNALVVLPDGRLASGAGDNSIRVWDVTSGAEIARLEGHSGGIRALVVLPDGQFASGSYDSTIRLWDMRSASEYAWPEAHTNGDGIKMLVLMPDGRLASGDGDNTIRIWDVTSGAEIARFEGCSAYGITARALLPDGRLVSGFRFDNSIGLCDLESGAETARLTGHGGWVKALALLPDGRLASGAGDNTIRLWNMETGAETGRLEGHSNWVLALAVLSDCRMASAGDNTVRLWDLTVGKEIARLEIDAAVRCLIALPYGRLVAADALGRLHWLEIVR